MTPSIAAITDCRRTASRSPGKWNVRASGLPSSAPQARHTVPTGFSGDDAYERYLAEQHRMSPAGAAISRAAFFSRYLEEKWRRYAACGRSGD